MDVFTSPAAGASASAAVAPAEPEADGEVFVYFGTHRHGANVGFSLARFHAGTGLLTPPVFLQEAVAPAYFALTPDGRRLYACNATPGNKVSAYAVDPATAQLTFLSEMPSGGGEPCYVSLDATGRYLMAANYVDSSVAVFALESDGSIGTRTAFVRHVGASVNPDRQVSAHAHSVHVDPTNGFVLAADLGADKLFVYRFNAETGALQANDPPYAAVTPGAGPRHFAFAPDGRALYLVNEMGSSISRFGWDAERGALTPCETVSALPDGSPGKSACAEILMHPGGRFLYATNRGHDSVAVFSVQPGTGRLALVHHVPTQGKTPRNCAFDPTGRWLLVSNQNSDSAVVFHVDPNSGQLTQNGPPVPVPAPLCVRFLATARSTD